MIKKIHVLFYLCLGTSLSYIGHLCIFCYVDNSRRCSTMWNNQDHSSWNTNKCCHRCHCDCDRKHCDCDDCRRRHCDCCHSHSCHSDCHCKCSCCCIRRNKCGCMNPFLGVDWELWNHMNKNNKDNKDKN
jgi:hypothetical protein